MFPTIRSVSLRRLQALDTLNRAEQAIIALKPKKVDPIVAVPVEQAA